MQTVTVTTKDDLEKAVKNKADKIIITGDLAQKIISSQKTKKTAKRVGIGGFFLAGLAAVAGIVAAPFTGGTSAVAGVSAAAATITAGAVTLSTAELVILVIGALAGLGIAANVIKDLSKNYDIKLSNGSASVEFVRKQSV